MPSVNWESANKSLNESKPPRTMPTTFARQGEEIKRLQAELDEAKRMIRDVTEAHYTEYSRAETAEAENKALREKLVLLEDDMSPHLAEVAETDTHFILLGTPGSHNCDEMGCGSVGHHVLMRVHKSEIGQHDDLLTWSRSAYTRLQSLMSIGVSLTPDAVTKQLLDDAPEAVKGGEA